MTSKRYKSILIGLFDEMLELSVLAPSMMSLLKEGKIAYGGRGSQFEKGLYDQLEEA